MQTNTILPQNMFSLMKSCHCVPGNLTGKNPNREPGKNPKQSFMKTEMQKNVVVIDRLLFFNGRFETGANDTSKENNIHSIRKRMMCCGRVWVQ